MALVAALTSAASLTLAQQPNSWQPTRMQVTSAVRPLGSGLNPVTPTARPASAAMADTATQSNGETVIFRWRKSQLANPIRSTNEAASAVSRQRSSAGQPPTGINHQQERSFVGGAATVRAVVETATANPLRASSNVELANYQVPTGTVDPFEEQLQPSQPALPHSMPPASSQLTPLPNMPGTSSITPNPGLPLDPLSVPEAAPKPGADPFAAPGAIPHKDAPSASPETLSLQPLDAKSPAPGHVQEEISPSDQQKLQQLPDSEDAKSDDRNDLTIPKSKSKSQAETCQDQRERARLPLTQNEINITPEYGEGLRPNASDQPKLRGDFIAKSNVRQWADIHGNLIATGRMLDIRNDIVTIDENGMRRRIPLRDLSDVDYMYAMKLWNLPTGCGSGDDTFEGRNYIASTFQFKASGLCHKPLYFEEVQLERYGHEVGPVLQPIISSVHFFGNIAVLPYKMGIHPMHECQYSLGYYRPGDCAPYMIPPIPWSLPGALSQAKAVVGGAALIP